MFRRRNTSHHELGSDDQLQKVTSSFIVQLPVSVVELILLYIGDNKGKHVNVLKTDNSYPNYG